MTTSPSPERKSLEYAMGLGLNSVYDDALASNKQIQALGMQLIEFRNRKRITETLRSDLEMEITEQVRAANPEMSVAALERLLKVEIANNASIRNLRDELVAIQGEIDLCEHQISVCEGDLKIAVARLHELGGYYQFMAVIKSTSEARKANRNKDEGNPWL